LPLAALLTIAANGMDGAGFVPHTIFWVDYIARVLGRGAGAGAFNWALFGAGALAGPFLAGALGDRIGLARTVTLAFACKALAVLLPVLTDAPAALALSSVVVGALSPGITTLVGARLTELVAPARLAKAWSVATLSLASFQAASAYGMSFALVRTGAYLPLYVAGAAFEAIGLLFCLGAISGGHRSRRQGTA
jgi:predicted MFS family arabinose efflux permease